MVTGKLAVWPFETVWLGEPAGVTAKSNPTPVSVASPLSGAVPPGGAVLEVTERAPVCVPGPLGAKTTPAVQLPCGASVAVQVLFTSWNSCVPCAILSASPFTASTLPGLVTVRVRGLLVAPTPKVEKVNTWGVSWIPGATPPVPLSATLTGDAADVELTVSALVTGPAEVGEKITPVVQLFPAARLPAQV